MTARKNKSDSESVPQVRDVRAFLPPELCNYEIPEVAQATCLSRSGVYDEIAAGNLATVTHGRRRLVPGVELVRFMKAFAERRTLDSGVKPRKRTAA
jgi:hypothetical protein